LLGKKELQAVESEVLGSVVNYCVEFVKQIWQLSEIPSTTEKNSENQLVLSAWDSGNVSKIEVERVLRTVIAERPFPLKIFSNYTRNLATPNGIIGPTVLGIVLGLHPEYDGFWAEQPESEGKVRVDKIVQFLSRSVSLHFDRLFPNDLAAADEDLFSYGAIYPPIGMRERYPLVERILTFSSRLRASDLSLKQIVDLGQRLMVCPDYQISALGLVIVGALTTRCPPELLSISERFGRSAGFLRPAVLELRKQSGIESNWTESTVEDEVSKLFNYESSIGLLPYIYWPAFNAKLVVANPDVRALNRALAQCDIGSSLAISSEIILADPKLIEVRIQKIYLEILTGAVDDADLGLRGLLTEPRVEEDWRVYSLLAITALYLGNFEDLKRYVQTAYQLCPSNSEKFGVVCNDYAKSLLTQGEFDLAMQVIDQGIKASVNPLSLKLTKLELLRALKRKEEVSSLIAELVKLSPLDSRVFTEKFFRN